MDGASSFDVESFVTGKPPKQQASKPTPTGGTKAKVYREAARARQLGYDVPDAVADDFYNLTALESGHSHFNKNGQVKLSPVDPKDGQAAVGYSQIKPGTIKKWHGGKLDPYNENDNILGGLLEFNSIDKNDPVARRIGYFSGEHSDALKYYRRTGKIPPGGDFTGTTFKKYIERTGADKASSAAVPFDVEQFVTGGKASDSSGADSDNFDAAKFVTGDNQAETSQTGQAMPSDEPATNFDVEQFVNASPNNTQSDKPRIDPMTGKIIDSPASRIGPPINQTVPTIQPVQAPLSLATDGQQPPAVRPDAPVIERSPRELTPEEIDPRLESSLQTPVIDLKGNSQQVLTKSTAQRRQTSNLSISQPALSDSQITPEQRAAAEAELNRFNQANGIENDNGNTQSAVNPVSIEQGAKNKLGSLTQVNLKNVNLKGEALKEYITRKSYEQVGRQYSFSPAEVDDLMQHSKEAGLIDEGQFQAQLKAAKARGDLNYKNIIPANQIQYVLDNRKANEQIANEQAARQQVNEQTTNNANSLTGRVLNAADKGLQKGYEYLNPLNAVRDMNSGEFLKTDSPEEVAQREQKAIYGDSSKLDGAALGYLQSIKEANSMDDIERSVDQANHLVKALVANPASTLLQAGGQLESFARRRAGEDVETKNTFLGTASDALRQSFDKAFQTNRANDRSGVTQVVDVVANLGTLAALEAIPGGQVLAPSLMLSQGAQAFYRDAKEHGSSEDIALFSGALGAGLQVPQIALFRKFFGKLSDADKTSFVKSVADKIRGNIGDETATALVRAGEAGTEATTKTFGQQLAENTAHGAAGFAAPELGKNLNAKYLAGYDPHRKETTGVGGAALTGALFGAGGTGLTNPSGIAELGRSEHIKRAVDGVTEIYKQTQIKPNLENLQDKLADIYDRADAANIALSADKIITELAPELAKLPRKVQAEMVDAIKAGDAEAQANSKPVRGLPEKSQVNEQAINQTQNAVEPAKTGSEQAAVPAIVSPQVGTNENISAPNAGLPAGDVIKPVTETPATLDKQTEAVANPTSEKAAVLFTDPYTAPPADSQSYRVKTNDGILIANQEKIAEQFGIHDGQTFVDFVKNHPNAVSQLLGKKPESYDPNNPVALTLDKNRNELSATNVSTPTEANQAFAKDRADYPNAAAEQKIVSTNDVIANRAAGNSQPKENALGAQTVQTERGTKANITPRVIDAKDLLTSLEEGYPSEFQPRDRSRTASKAQISEIASNLKPEFLR